MGTKLYVGNLQYSASEDDLRDLFSEAGEVSSVKLITDSITGKARGFGFVEMSNDETAAKAISMFNGKDFMDRVLVVNEARPQDKPARKFGSSGPRDREYDRGFGGGGRGGGGGGGGGGRRR